MKSVRRLGVLWQILTTPCNDMVSLLADSLPPTTNWTRQVCRRILGYFPFSFFLSFFFFFFSVHARQVKTMPLHCCMLISWQSLLLRPVSSPGRSREYALFTRVAKERANQVACEFLLADPAICISRDGTELLTDVSLAGHRHQCKNWFW